MLLAGGVGITPLLAMLRHVVYEGLRTRAIRPTILIQAARSREDRPFAEELAGLAAAAGGAVRIVRVLSDPGDAVAGIDYDAAGRIDTGLLARVLPFGDYDFYLCGPPAFTQALYDGLRGLNIADDRIHAEAFGPAALMRSAPAGAAVPQRPPAAAGPVASRLPERLQGGALDARGRYAPGTRRGPWPEPGVQLPERHLRVVQDQAPGRRGHLRA